MLCRHFPPNFYYNQEDYLARRVREGASWTWNALRPGPICGFSHGSFMNIVVSTALYATLCKELDLGVLRCAVPMDCADSKPRLAVRVRLCQSRRCHNQPCGDPSVAYRLLRSRLAVQHPALARGHALSRCPCVEVQCLCCHIAVGKR